MKWLLSILLFAGFAHADDFNWNASLSPLRFVVGPNARIDRRVNENLSVGIFGAWYDHSVKAVYLNGAEVGAAVTWGFQGALSPGFFVEGAVKYGDLRAEVTSSEGDVYLRHLVNWGGIAVGGYRWYWWRINISVDAGVAANTAGGQTIYNSVDHTDVKIPIYPAQFYGDISVGLAF